MVHELIDDKKINKDNKKKKRRILLSLLRHKPVVGSKSTKRCSDDIIRIHENSMISVLFTRLKNFNIYYSQYGRF